MEPAITISAPPAPGVLAELLRGAFAPSALACSIMLACCAGLLAFPALLITPQLMREHGAELFPTSSRDYDAFASIRALELAAHAGHEPILVITGGSTVRDGLRAQFIEEALRGAGQPVSATYKLTTSRQSLVDTAALLDMIPERTRGVAIIGIQPGVFVISAAGLRDAAGRGRYAFASEVYDRELRRFGIYAYDNLRFLLARKAAVWENLSRGHGPRYSETHNRDRAVETPQRWQWHGRELGKRFAHYDENLIAVRGVLERLVRRLKRHGGMQIVLLEPPVNPRFLDEFGHRALYERHRQWVAAFAHEYGLAYLNLNEAVTFDPGEFFDWAHLNDETAVRRAATAVAAVVAPVLAELAE